MSRIRNFLYRSPRFTADCRMDFILGDAVILGTCTDLSESGLRGTFSGPISPNCSGLLTLYHEGQNFQVKANVYAMRGDEARLRFSFASDKERLAIAGLVKLLAGRPPQ